MKNKIAITAITLLTAACETFPRASLEYKQYENPKGGVVYVYPDGNIAVPSGTPAKNYEKIKAEVVAKHNPKNIMTNFCAPEPYRVVAEGKLSNVSGASSQQIGAVTITNVNRSEQPYIQFACGDRKPASEK